MRIGIDARMYRKGGFGLARYIQKLLEHLEAIPDTNEYVVFLLRSQMDAYMPQDPRFRKVCADVPWYTLREQIEMPFILSREGLDLMHFPHFNVPLAYFGASLVTIHDLIMLTHPLSAASAVTTRHPFIHNLKHLALRCCLYSAVKRARTVITVSSFVKKQLCERYCLPDDRVIVAYEAGDIADTIENMPDVRRPYVLCAGSAYPHKNISVLLDAWSVLQEKGDDLSLYLCGQEDVFTERLRKKIAERGLGKTVRHLGTVSDEALAGLYRGALATISPSLEEGFGLPPLESILYGTPVLVSDIPVYREILNDACLFFNPTSADDILNIINEIRNESTRSMLLERGRAVAARYSWRACAQKTHDAYCSVQV